MIYDGHWANDKRHGRGLLRLGLDRNYEGEFVDGKAEGSGVLTENSRNFPADCFQDVIVTQKKVENLGNFIASNLLLLPLTLLCLYCLFCLVAYLLVKDSAFWKYFFGLFFSPTDLVIFFFFLLEILWCFGV